MPIQSITTDLAGEIGVVPRIVRIKTSDSNAQVVATGYLNKVYKEGFVIYSTDVVFVNLAANQFGIYTPVITAQNISLTPWVSSVSPGNVTVDVTVTTQAMSTNTVYLADSASLVTFTLPTVAAVGDIISVVGINTGGWRVNQSAGQQVLIGALATTVGAGGYIASTNAKDSFYFICVQANTKWASLGAPQGNITIV